MSDAKTICWSCGAAREPADALCPSCGKVQPPPPSNAAKDRFSVLGFPRGYEVDAHALDERFRALSRKLHPDRYARAPARERRFSLEQTTLLNDAYRVLKDPARRAEHLLELRGIRPLSETAMPEEFLEEAMADREQLLEAKTEGGADGVDKLAAGIRAKRDSALAEIARLLGEPEPLQASLARAAELLARLRYYARYLDEALGRAPEM
jgi:molecular chaperone HscB